MCYTWYIWLHFLEEQFFSNNNPLDGQASKVKDGELNRELALKGCSAFVWPCLAFLLTFFKSSGSYLSADTKKSKIG